MAKKDEIVRTDQDERKQAEQWKKEQQKKKSTK